MPHRDSEGKLCCVVAAGALMNSASALEGWLGTWTVERRENWTQYLTFMGIPPEKHEEETQAAETHRLRVDASALSWEYELASRPAHWLCRADLDGQFRRVSPLSLAYFGVTSDQTEMCQWRHCWIQDNVSFKCELANLPGKPGVILCTEWLLISPVEASLTIKVSSNDVMNMGPSIAHLRKQSSQGPAPVAWLRRHGRPLKTAEQRCEVLGKVVEMISENVDAISAAQEADRVFPSRFNGVAQMLIGGANMYKSHVESWMSPEEVDDSCPEPLKAGVLARWYVVNEPKGVCINISPWNAPVQLSVIPMLGMVASGNHCVIKPPDLVPNVSALVRRLCQHYLDGFVWVEEGSKEAVERLIDEGADHLVFTGGGEIAKVVAARCAQVLTPMTLELGGKSPVYFDKSLSGAMLDDAVREILELKVHKTGQFCCAHDYALVHEEIYASFCAKFVVAVEGLGEKRHVALIGRRQYQALKENLEDAKAECIPPMKDSFVPRDDLMTVPFSGLLEPSLKAKFLTAEIFGPVLPILKVRSSDEAITIINQMVTGKPLIAYCYSNDETTAEAFVHGTSSGNLAINSGPQRMVSNFNCAFGGVGPSGMGAAMWGREAMREFSNRKYVIHAKEAFAKSFFSGPPPAPR
eukprot:TRINITY_DN77911_c0_g1_i1.p1 TRINITY_DN77911_c0_g1~~TRINITY_DN77911_c0_g1_i1.p1  ORF type:complete len:655 (-),score=90.79 TRINITY_DN77911_c0_g1_i1:180-2093(-)